MKLINKSKIINLDERVKMVKCMEFIARHINDENILDGWLMYGVDDGAIDFGDLSDEMDLDMMFYIEEHTLSELMQTFLECMKKAKKDGLYCDGVLSGV